MLSQSLNDGIKSLYEKNKRLTYFINEISSVNIELLHLCLHVDKDPRAKQEFDKLSDLVLAIKKELKHLIQDDLKLEFDCEAEGDQFESEKVEEILEDQQVQSTRTRPRQKQAKEKRRHSKKNEQSLRTKEKIETQSKIDIDEEIHPQQDEEGHEDSGMEFSTFIEKHQDTHSKSDIGTETANDTVLLGKGKTTRRKCTRSQKQKKTNADVNDKYISSSSKKRKPSVIEGPVICERCGKELKNRATLNSHLKLHKEKDANLPHNCNVCGKHFIYSSALRQHMKSHTSTKDFLCTQCGKCFNQAVRLKLHMRVHSENKPYVCEVCNKSFSRSGNLGRHKLIHTGEKPWKCTYCDKAFNQSTFLNEHLRIHTGERPFKCTVCNKSFKTNAYLAHHRRFTHIIGKDEDPVENFTGEDHDLLQNKCSICNRLFKCESDLIKHQTLHDKPYNCPICLKKFINKTQLNSHCRKHNTSRTYKCTQCDKAFSCSSYLIKHLNIHDKPHQCSVCFKKFSNTTQLKNHKRKHTGSSGKTFHCKLCNRGFFSIYNMRRHMLLHSGSKEFKCNVCGRSFSQKSNLDVHVWTHRSDKRFYCDICGKGYNDRRNLQSHAKTHSQAMRPTNVQNMFSMNEYNAHASQEFKTTINMTNVDAKSSQVISSHTPVPFGQSNPIPLYGMISQDENQRLLEANNQISSVFTPKHEIPATVAL